MDMRLQSPSTSGSAQAKLLCSLKGHTAAVEALAFSPDRRLLASGGRDGTGHLWDVASSSKPGAFAVFRKSGEGFRSLAFSPSGRLVAAGFTTNLISLYDVDNKAAQQIRLLRGGAGSTDALKFSPDSKMLAGGGEDKTLRVWEPSSGAGGDARILLPGHTEPIQALAFAPDGQTAATAGQDATARVWSLSRIRASQRASLPHGGAVTTVAYSPDGKTLATAVHNKTILLWDLTSIKPTLRAELAGYSKGIRLVLITPDAEMVIGVGVENHVINWSFRSGELRSVWELPAGRALSVALTLDGRYFARGMDDGTVEVFRVAEKRS